MARTTVIPLSFWPLLAAAVALALWLLRGGEDPARPVPLVPVAAVDVVRLTVDGAGPAVDLRREPDGWILAGPERDALEPGAVDDVVAALCAARRAGEALPPDPAYGLDAPGALHVTVTARDGRTWALDMGAINPVTEVLYVRGEDGVPHLAEPAVRDRLARLPDTVRARQVWPAGPSPLAADTLTVRREGGAPWVFVQDELERWWWVVRPEMRAAAGEAAAYQAVADDRRREAGGRELWLADDRRLRNLLSELATSPVMSFHPDERSLLGSDGRTAPLQLAVSVAGERREYVIGGETESGRVDVWRRPARRGFETRSELRDIADVPLEAWLHRDALTVRLALADSFALSLSGAGAITAHPVNPDPARNRPPRDGWAPERGASVADDTLGDLAYLVDRLTMQRVLPPEPDPAAVFHDQARLTVTTWQRGPGLPAKQTLVLGVNRERTAVVAWRPADGVRMAVPNTLLVSGRNLLRELSESRR